MSKEDFYSLVQKYLDGKATQQEKEFLDEWYNSFDDTEAIVPAEATETELMVEEQMMFRLRSAIKQSKEDTKPGRTFVLRPGFKWMAVAAIFLGLMTGLYFALGMNKTSKTELAENEMEEEGEERWEYDGMDKATALMLEQTKDPATGRVPWNKLWVAIQQTEEMKYAAHPDAIAALSWIERGPNGDFARVNGNPRQNDDQTSGRIRATMIDSLDPTHKTVFVGSVAGGLWKTTDITVAPANWTLVNDFMANLAIGDITQDPRPGFQNNMYLCTGESYFNADAVRGVGVFKSTDGGANWNFLPSTSTYLNGTRILCDNAGNVYLGTRGSGLLRSTDGGATWTNIVPAGIGTDVCDLELSSTGRMHVTTGIFSTSGYRFTDNPATVTSATWTSATTPFTTFNQRTEMGVLGNTLYACPDNAAHQVPTIWKSTDGGVNWASTLAQPGGGTWANGQGWYDLIVGINPANANEVIVGGLDCYKSINGGNGWAQLTRWVGPSALTYVHADQQDVQWWDGGTKLMFACDGGIHYSTNGGTTASDRNKGLRIKQFYSVAIHPTDVNNFIAGAQDNGMHRLNHPGLDSSIEFYGGDGMYCAIDQNQPQFQFGSAFNNNIRRSLNGGVSWSNVSFTGGRFVSPWDYDNAGNMIYLCSGNGNYIRWNDPQTGTGSNTITVADFGGLQVSAVHVSPYTANRVFFGTSNGSTSRLVMLDAANTATPTSAIITPAGSAGYLNCVVTGSNDQNLIACYTNYGVTNVWRSTDGGTTWTACDGNLPDMPVRWALFHPDSDTKAFIATATGVWETDLLNGASTVWVPNTSFPNVSTDMIKYRTMDRTIAAGTHGRGVWTAIVPVSGSGFTFTTPPPATATCPAPATMDIVLGTTSIGGFSNNITLTNTIPPGGTTLSYIPGNVVTPGNNVTVRLTGTNTLAPGSYTITITGTATGATTQTRDITYTINPGTGPAITAQPANQTVCEGGNASFSITSATATGFQWQLSTDGGLTYNNIPVGAPYGGTTTATLSITGVTLAMNNNRYRCIASTQCGTTTSNPAILTVNAATAITAQPTNVSTCTGTSAQFCVTAVGTGLTYQWQLSTTGCGGPWANIAGANSNCYTIPSVTVGMSGTAYQCVVTGTCAPLSVTSSCATLTVATSLTITGQPANATVCEGSNASFTVTATGVGTYQWQVSTDGGGTYNNIPVGAPYGGTTSAALTITGVTAAMNNYRYRVNLSSGSCGSATSNEATLTVNTLPTITSHPASATACTGTNHTFSATATGTGITYQWQVSTDGGITYNNVPAAPPYSGTTTANLTITNITSGLNNNRYRVVVTGTCPPAATSNPATLTVLTAVSITSNPANQTICEGTNTSFTVGAVGTGFQWQVSTDGGITYNNVPAAPPYSGTTTATLTITAAPPSLNGNRYRAVVTNGSCTPGTSAPALLTVNTFPIIGTPPASLTICEGGTSTFSVAATTGVGVLSYQWQVSTDGGITYTNIAGATTNTFSQTAVPVTQNGYRFRVIVTAGCGSVTSAVAVLTVNALPVINFTLPFVICLSDPALSLSATPGGGTFSGPGVSGNLFSPSLAGLGQKTLLYTATNAGCVSTASKTITVNECGERHLTLEQFPAVVIYPSPNNGRFSIRINTDLYTKLGLKAYNSLGQMVWSQNFTGVAYGTVLPVDLSRVPSGTYHLFLFNEERGVVSKKGASIIIYRD